MDYESVLTCADNFFDTMNVLALMSGNPAASLISTRVFAVVSFSFGYVYACLFLCHFALVKYFMPLAIKIPNRIDKPMTITQKAVHSQSTQAKIPITPYNGSRNRWPFVRFDSFISFFPQNRKYPLNTPSFLVSEMVYLFQRI